ncbi:MAG: NVEALA domain-containing protein [Parabacteroides gordonii]|uniref:NVEALA domain-containing protein n=1 Tax=Parabacteroides gordonii TaxID=574930 RepID=UPI003A8B0F18
MKKSFGIIVIATIAVAASWNFNNSKNEVNLSDLTLANVEALAQSESDYDKKIWERHYREDNTGYNCSKTGSETC